MLTAVTTPDIRVTGELNRVLAAWPESTRVTAPRAVSHTERTPVLDPLTARLPFAAIDNTTTGPVRVVWRPAVTRRSSVQ
jgi:hypothetical protein